MAKDKKAKLPDSVSILGTEYIIETIDPPERGDYVGFCSKAEHKIQIVDLSKHPEWKDGTDIDVMTKETMRHEIVHAFFNESGLKDSSNVFTGGWSTNEEMIDWIAIQGPKIMAAWKEAGCL